MKTVLLDKERISAVLASIGDGVISTDINGKIEFINSSAVSITEWKAHEAVGADFDTVFRVFDINTGERSGSPVKKALETGGVVGLQNGSVLKARNGSNKYVSASCSPIKVPGAGITGVVVVFRDITRIKTLENENTSERDNLKVILNSNPVGMFVLNEDLLISQVNNVALELLGKKNNEVVGKSFGNELGCLGMFGNGKDCGFDGTCCECEFNNAIRKAFDEGDITENLEYSNVSLHKGNERRLFFRASFVPITIKDKRNVVISLADITDSKLKEILAVRANKSFLKMMENFPTMVWRVDTKGNCDYVNKVWCDFSGLNDEEAMDNGCNSIIHPEDRNYYHDILTASLKNRIPYEIVLRMRRYDGEYRWVTHKGAPYYDLDNNIAGYIGTASDITERKIEQEGLKRYQVLTEKARDIILFVDKDGRIIDANEAAAKAYGYKRSELLTKTIFEISGTGSLSFNQIYEKAESGGIFFEMTHKRKDGSTFPVEVSSQEADIGGTRLLISIIRDITERKEAEIAEHNTKEQLRKAKEEAEKANMAKSEFLANMSHEIRTPLNGVIGMIDITLFGELTSEQTQNLHIAKNCAYSLLHLINDILDFSKMEACKLKIEKVSFNFRQMIEETVKFHSPSALEKNLELKYILSPDIPKFVSGDPNRLRQVINNLINNAVKFTGNGSVTLIVKVNNFSEDSVELEFSVVDTGIGIAKEDINKLFRSFSQIDGSYTKKFGGTGLGLVISKQLVEMMGGSIRVESEKGIGSSFSFSIRLAIGTNVENQDKTSKRSLYNSRKNSLRILVVEDDIVNQTILERILTGNGHAVDVANNGQEALELYDKHEYDVILMDINMPVMDGIETTQNIRESEGDRKHTEIIALTAYALNGDRERFLSKGMDDYIPKPIVFESLFEKLENLAESMVKKTVPVGAVRLDRNGGVIFIGESSIKPDEDKSYLLEDIQKSMAELASVIEGSDLKAIEAAAGRIKSLSNQIEAGELKNSAFRIELSARRGDMREVIGYSMQIANEFETLKKLFPKISKKGEQHENSDC